MSKMKGIIAILVVAAAITGYFAFTGQKEEAVIKIFDGQFSEMRLIHQMVKMLVEAETPVKVNILDEVAPVNSYKSMVKGEADLMNSYDGTLLTTYLHLDPSDVPQGTTLYDFANQEGAKQGVKLLDKLGLNNTYAIGVTKEVMEKYNPKGISDLVPIADKLVFGAEHDFFTEEGSAKYNPMVAFYGLKFKEAKQVDLNLKYAAFESGGIDVMIVYATDGLNRKAKLTVLEDDKHFFPEYNGALLVRSDLFERLKTAAPKLEEILNRLGGKIPSETMVNLTYAVDVDGKDTAEVAREFLKSQGLLK